MAMTTDEQIASNVRAELARRRLSGKEAAERIGMEVQSFRRRTAGLIPFTASELVALADALDVEPAALLPTTRRDLGASA